MGCTAANTEKIHLMVIGLLSESAGKNTRLNPFPWGGSMSARKALFLIAILSILVLIGLTPAPVRAASPLYGVFLISDQAADITHSAIAYNTKDHNYLVVWCHQQAGSVGVFARTISETGQLGAVYPVSDTSGSADRCDPDVAYNSKQDNYLVVWQQKVGANFTVHGRVFSPGAILGSDITISNNASSAATPPSVDYADTADEFLVVWAYWSSGVNSSILSQRISYVGGAIGANFIVSQGLNSLSAYDPDVAYNLARNEYLVVYTRLDTNAQGGPNKDIFGYRLTYDEVKLGSEIQIAYFTPQELHPVVAALPTAAPESGRYLVAYQITYSTGDSDLWGRIVAGDGTPLAPGNIVIQGTEAYETVPAIACSQAGRSFLVTWKAAYPPSYAFPGIMARTVNPDGTSLAPTWLGGVFADIPSVAAGRGGEYLVAAEDTTLFGNRDLYGRLMGNRNYIPRISNP